MGFSVYYRSTRPVTPARANTIAQAARDLCKGRSWLKCEPVGFFYGQDDGHLFGGSKPNFLPDPEDAASAAKEGLPDGTLRDVIDILCQLSLDHEVDWEISHDHSDGSIGYIRGGICDDPVLSQMEGVADLSDAVAALNEEPQPDDDEDEGPQILSFRPKGQ